MVKRQYWMIILVSAILAAASACGSAQASQPDTSPAAHVSQLDRHWVDQAHLADMAEIQAGQFAALIGGTAAIRSAGSELVRDHMTLDGKVIRVAGALKLQLPQSLTVQQTEIGDRLSKELGHAFDHDFTASMMTAHQALIAATMYEITHGSSAEVVNLARQTLPVLEKHLKMMQTLAPTG